MTIGIECASGYAARRTLPAAALFARIDRRDLAAARQSHRHAGPIQQDELKPFVSGFLRSEKPAQKFIRRFFSILIHGLY